MRTVKLVLPYLLIAAGAVLVYQGARVYLQSKLGQTEAQRQFVEHSSGEPAETESGVAAPPQDGEAIAKLTIPRLDTELYVVEGDDDKDLRLGPGHLPGTAMPGADGNCVIAGHRDTHFRVLKDLKKGDEIILETSHGDFRYRVEDTRVVPPTNTKPLLPTSDAELHLITCYPFYYIGSAPKRFVVQAELEGKAPGPS